MVLCGGTAPSEAGLSVNKNGAAESRGICYRSDLTASKNATFSGIAEVECVAGDTLGVYSYCTGQNVSITNSSGTSDASYINISRISGPSQIAASEKVYARYSSNAAQTLSNNTDNLINYEDVELDSHGAVTIGASWKFTAPRAGMYLVNTLNIGVPANAWDASGEYFAVRLFKNGSQAQELTWEIPQIASTVRTTIKGTGIIKLNAGDYINIYIFQNCGGNFVLDNWTADNYIEISSFGGI